MNSAKSNAANAASNAKFAKMTDQFVKDSLALSPVNASQAGYHKHVDPKTGKTIELDAQLDDVGPQGLRRSGSSTANGASASRRRRR